jgi:hypothetical protein
LGDLIRADVVRQGTKRLFGNDVTRRPIGDVRRAGVSILGDLLAMAAIPT